MIFLSHSFDLLVYVCFAYVCIMCNMCMLGTYKVRTGHQILRNWNYVQLGATVWVLGVKPAYSARTTHALNL